MCGIKSLQTGPGRIVLAIFSWSWRPIHQLQSQHGKVKLQGIRRNADPVVQHAVRFGDDAIAKRPSIALRKKTLPQQNQTFPWHCNQTSPLGFLISDPNIQGQQCRAWSPWIVAERMETRVLTNRSLQLSKESKCQVAVTTYCSKAIA